MLTRRGHDVELLERSSEAVGPVTAARGLVAGGLDSEQVVDAVRKLKPDVVHAHNLHPLFGWRALAAARVAGARTVLHLHNFRLFCAIGIAYRDGAPCFRCQSTNMHPGIRLRCRGSLTEAAVYGFGLHRQLPRLLEHADAFVTLSQASKTRLAQLGLPARKAAVLPNFVPTKMLASESRADSGTFALAAGRLAPEKGFDTAIAAARGAGVHLVIAGTGPDEGRLRSLADDSVKFVGHLPADQLSQLRGRAAVALVPSRCEEHCPYAVLEALASGLPVLASDRGGLPELVGEEATVAADDLQAWTTALQRLWRDPKLRLSRGRDALARARDRFDENRHYTGLLSVYGDHH